MDVTSVLLGVFTNDIMLDHYRIRIKSDHYHDHVKLNQYHVHVKLDQYHDHVKHFNKYMIQKHNMLYGSTYSYSNACFHALMHTQNVQLSQCLYVELGTMWEHTFVKEMLQEKTSHRLVVMTSQW